MKSSATKTIIILGMHRSGTSMVAGVLNILGVNMGKNLIGPDWSNPLGHFENIEFVRLNDEILKEAGGSWDNPPKREEILTQKGKFSLQIKNLIEKEKSEIWGWKDPRTSLTIELYLPYLENPYFIVCYRDSEKIAHSLEKRNKMKIEKGMKLSEVYNSRIKNFFQSNLNFKKLELSYEKVIEYPERHLKRIISFLEISPSKEQYQKALGFILSPERKERLKKIRRFQLFLLKKIAFPQRALRFVYKKIFLNKK